MARSTPDRVRYQKGYFIDPTGVRLPSVSTILNATKPPEARERLAKWRDRLGTEEATRVATNASRRGSMTHKQIRGFLAGENPECPEPARPYWNSIVPVLEEIQEVKLLEEPVLHYEMGYAGKVDCVASYQDVPCVCDWKTADAPKGSVERLYDAPLQLAAYCGAVNHFCAEQRIAVRQAMVVVAVANQPAEVFWFEPERMLEYWREWELRVEAFYRRFG